MRLADTAAAPHRLCAALWRGGEPTGWRSAAARAWRPSATIVYVLLSRRGGAAMGSPAAATIGESLRTTGQALVEGLLTHGVDTVFGIPGVQTYPLFDALAEHSGEI